MKKGNVFAGLIDRHLHGHLIEGAGVVQRFHVLEAGFGLLQARRFIVFWPLVGCAFRPYQF